MKKTLLLIVLMMAGMQLYAGTARKITVNLTPDGAANLQVFLPEHPNGRAVVGCPGGGYSHLSMQNEGTDWVNFFNNMGITYGVLTYRMPKGDRTVPMTDAQNAIRTMRDSAAVWGISPYDVGIMGFCFYHCHPRTAGGTSRFPDTLLSCNIHGRACYAQRLGARIPW